MLERKGVREVGRKREGEGEGEAEGTKDDYVLVNLLCLFCWFYVSVLYAHAFGAGIIIKRRGLSTLVLSF